MESFNFSVESFNFSVESCFSTIPVNVRFRVTFENMIVLIVMFKCQNLKKMHFFLHFFCLFLAYIKKKQYLCTVK